MDCSCNCFGIAASSKKPVKRYNLLVPDIFPNKASPFAEHVDPSTERKLKKLYEYLEKNLHRGPKVHSLSQEPGGSSFPSTCQSCAAAFNAQSPSG